MDSSDLTPSASLINPHIYSFYQVFCLREPWATRVSGENSGSIANGKCVNSILNLGELAAGV